MVHTPGHNSKSSSVRRPGTKPPKPTIFQGKSKTKRPKPVKKPQNTLQNRLRKERMALRSSVVGKAEMASNAAKGGPASVRTDDQPSPGKPIGRQYENKARKRVAAANAANAPKKRVTPPADMRPKSKSSSVVKPTNEEARRTAQAKRLGTTPAAKKKTMPQAVSIDQRVKTGTDSKGGAFEAITSSVKNAWGAFTKDQARRRKDTQTRNAYRSTGMDDPVATKTKLPRVASINQTMAPGSKGEVKKVAPTLGDGYNKTGMDDADYKTEPSSVSKNKKAESVAEKVTPKAEVKVAESKYSYRGGQRPRGPINPTKATKNPAAAKKAGDNMRVPDRIETGFEASMLRGMSKIFGGARMSVPSGMEGTDSWSTLSVDSTGRVTRKRRKSNPRRNMGDQDN